MTRFRRALVWGTLFTLVSASVAQARSRRWRSSSRYTLPAGSATHVLKPLEAIGLGKKRVARITDQLQDQLTRIPGVKMAPLKPIRRFLKGRGGVTYSVCEGELSCVIKFGQHIKAPLVVAGDLSGLGAGFVLFLRLVDPKAGTMIRKVTVVFGGKSGRADSVLKEAAFRLLAPDRFVGKLQLEIDVKGAMVYLNGKPLGRSPVAAIQVQAGTHALRITHSEYHDFLRFVEVGFEKTTTLKASLKQYPIISEDMRAKARQRPGAATHPALPGQQVLYRPLPWYKQWWFVTAVGAVVLATTLTTVALVRQRHLERDGSVTLSKELRGTGGAHAPAYLRGFRPAGIPVIRFGP